MTDPRGEKLRELIFNDREGIKNIIATVGEYYFRYANKAFSLLRRDDGNYVLFGYPRWGRSLEDLIEVLDRGYDDHESTYIVIHESREDRVLFELFEWLKSKHTGIDDFFRDLGIYE